MNEKHYTMERLILTVKWMAATLSALWISTDLDLQVLAVLLCVDVLTGLANPRKRLADGLKRSALTAILVLTIHWVYIKAQAGAGFNVGIDLSTVVCSFYILGTVLEIVDNCRPWISIPPALDAVLTRAEGLTRRESSELNLLKARQSGERAMLELEQQDRKKE